MYIRHAVFGAHGAMHAADGLEAGLAGPDCLATAMKFLAYHLERTA
jgi:hypothetical protein